jgi:hypothetical protein
MVKKIVIYYAEKAQLSSQPSCVMFKINCLLDGGEKPWTIEDDDITNVLKENGISILGTPHYIEEADIYAVHCDIENTNLDDFYNFDDAPCKDIIMWRKFRIFYDTYIGRSIFGNFNNINELEPFFSKIVSSQP